MPNGAQAEDLTGLSCQSDGCAISAIANSSAVTLTGTGDGWTIANAAILHDAPQSYVNAVACNSDMCAAAGSYATLVAWQPLIIYGSAG
jgi:hypothetical protein